MRNNSKKEIINVIPQSALSEGLPFPERAAIIPCNEPIVFPHMIAPVLINEEKHMRLVDDAFKGDRLVAFFPTEKIQKKGKDGVQNEATRLLKYGTLCAVLRMLRVPDGSMRLLVHGITRIKATGLTQQSPYMVSGIELAKETTHQDDVEVDALRKETMESLQKAVMYANLSEDLLVAALNVEEAGKLADLVASNVNLSPKHLISIHQELDTKKRLRQVYDHLSREVHVMEIGNNISEQVRESVDKNQREFYLREQIRVMQTELGQSDPQAAEIQELRARLESKQMPDYARKIADKELSRLSMLQPAAAEYGVVRTYIDHILDLPFVERTDDHLNMLRAAEILDEDHYGLEKVKQRILEYLAVVRLKRGNLKGPILCLVGPPGVGKTSLGKSIARAMGRKFHRFSLGGMRDEAEIRGHRRTYIGAMPGRIVKSLLDCATINPLIMLDEVDKIGSDFRGDPSSALLEVLDPEQNDSFQDHYMDMPVDLSQVMFITTANSLDTIPGPLRDRMEIIRIAGYTPEEKLKIAERYLVKREIKNAGLTQQQLRFSVAGLRHIIADYTAEAGVRNLQQQIASVTRKVARTIAEEESRVETENQEKPQTTKQKAKPKAKKKTTALTPQAIEELLGPSKFKLDVAEQNQIPGVATGLAWTSVGGEILFVEASRFPGKGNLRLTGQLGDVMKESVSAAQTFLRSNRHLISVEDSEFADFDYHVHVPAGATPKDGPSAGVAMVSALASLMTGESIRDYLAMTGEISLRGNVLPVGGVKEKILAAHRSGIKEVLLPHKNMQDLDEIPESVRKVMTFHPLERTEEAFQFIFNSRRVKTKAPQKTRAKAAPKTTSKKPAKTTKQTPVQPLPAVEQEVNTKAKTTNKVGALK
ncbi:MAG: endopeptidase La [Sumerlaeia bacterium]